MTRIPITLPFYFDFGADTAVLGDELRSAEAWDSLRTRTSGEFAIACDRAELESALSAHPAIRARANAVAQVLRDQDVRRAASYGVGAGFLEAGLEAELPGVELTIGEYAPATVERLRRLFPNATVVLHDLLEDPAVDADFHVMHRIDTEFTATEWDRIFTAHRTARIIFVPGGEMALRGLVETLVQSARRRTTTRAGVVRSTGAVERLWRRTHSARPVVFYDLRGWILEPWPG
jgi:hypothetical protein